MTDAARVARLSRGDVTPVLLSALETGAVMARADVAVLALAGPGAAAAMQGLLTNDIEKPGDGAFVYGALLTPKGMIVVDGWAARLGTTIAFTVPAEGRERAQAIFSRWVPPRLARASDRTADATVFRLVGPQTLAHAQAAGIPVPGVGRVTAAAVGGVACEVARATESAPFTLQLAAPTAAAGELAQRLVAAGAFPAGPAALECTRVLAGWPRLGVEVDDKTIPQEVRFDELGGLSYTKGCYTGQETVSRLHFRGHVNRQLRGLLFDAEPMDDEAAVSQLDREVGRVTSVVWIPDARIAGGGRWLGLAMLRREVRAGAVVRAAGRDARVVELPFAPPFVAPA
jgi:tRNA-modifying protein YgfZ